MSVSIKSFFGRSDEKLMKLLRQVARSGGFDSLLPDIEVRCFYTHLRSSKKELLHEEEEPPMRS